MRAAFLLLALLPLWAQAEPRQCLIVGISDGDTITARCGQPGAYEQVKVRLSAIDAPEKAQPFGERSRQHLADLCFQQLATITTRSTDRYGRTVADVECRGQDAGQRMVWAGMAWFYVRYGAGYSHLAGFEEDARTAKRGLWVDLGTGAPPVAPWDWRKRAKERPTP